MEKTFRNIIFILCDYQKWRNYYIKLARHFGEKARVSQIFLQSIIQQINPENQFHTCRTEMSGLPLFHPLFFLSSKDEYSIPSLDLPFVFSGATTTTCCLRGLCRYRREREKFWPSQHLPRGQNVRRSGQVASQSPTIAPKEFNEGVPFSFLVLV